MEIHYSSGVIKPEEVIKFLALSGQGMNIHVGIVQRKEVMKKARELGINVPDEELQNFSDNYRMARGLYSAVETSKFLKDSGLEDSDLEEFCETELLTISLKDYLAPENKVKDYFVNNRPDFDLARVYAIVVEGENLANELMMRVMEDGEDFHKLARKYSLDKATQYSGGYVGEISRRDLPPEISAKVFNASNGDLLSPFKREKLFQLILVEEVIRAELNARVKEAIKERIFEEWVSQFLKDGLRIDS